MACIVTQTAVMNVIEAISRVMDKAPSVGSGKRSFEFVVDDFTNPIRIGEWWQGLSLELLASRFAFRHFIRNAGGLMMSGERFAHHLFDRGVFWIAR